MDRKVLIFDAIAGDRAEKLRRRIPSDGTSISEESFRELAPPSWEELLNAIKERFRARETS